MDEMDSIEIRALRWAVSEDVGSSSKALAAVMSGNPPKKGHVSYPLDGGDLGRCLRLLEMVPEWRARIKEMGAYNAAWAALAAHWDELTDLHAKADYATVYKRMKEILAAPEAADTKLVKVGTASIRFGA